MSTTLRDSGSKTPTHPWLRSTVVAFVPGPTTPLLKRVANGLRHHFRLLGHRTTSARHPSVDAVLTTARFGDVVRWREALLFSVRKRFALRRAPAVFTLIHITPKTLEQVLSHLTGTLAKESPDATDYAFRGLAPEAYRVLHEQGRRGGPILPLARLTQAQAKSIRVILIVGDDRPLKAYHFDLVGAHPQTRADDEEFFYRDIVLRIVTAVATREITQHNVTGEFIPHSLWQTLSTPAAMRAASREFKKRNFFTEMVRIADLVHVPAVSEAVANQYSEGCYATWEPTLAALIATATGSARPVDKGNISDDELAIIIGVRPDGRGAFVRHVEGKKNPPPSSEAVEMIAMDQALPAIVLGPSHGVSGRVPVVRSKLHGHRGVAAYDPHRVQYAPLDPPYHHYLVSCGTEAQAQGVKQAFAHSEALQNPEDPRRVVFTVLPGHGIIIVEKWVDTKAPFQVIWEHMDSGRLVVENRVPQGPLQYVAGSDGMMVLQDDRPAECF